MPRSRYGGLFYSTIAASLALLTSFFSHLFSVAAVSARDLFAGLGGASTAFVGPSMSDVSPSLYQRGRHEAGVSRRSAARNV